MERELVFATVAMVLFTVLVWASAASACGRRSVPSSGEGSALLRLTWPLLTGVSAVAFLAGWALQEPDPADEWVSSGIVAVAAAASAVVLRALARALLSLRRAASVRSPVATVGILCCRTIVSDEFRRSAGREVLAAALSHEAAHARSRDPLRIWLAQLAADLQWPVPGARQRLESWLHELEMRRDDEALAGGASATALAESILLAARLDRGSGGLAGAAVTGDGSGLALRVRRLLSSEGGARAAHLGRFGRPAWLACLVVVPAAIWLGSRYGDTVLPLLPGVGR